MKLIAIIAFLFSSTAVACPNLTGTFVSQQGDSTTTITQSVSNGITTYTSTSTYEGQVETEVIVADGVTRTETTKDQGVDIVSTFSSACQGAVLVNNFNDTYSYEGNVVGSIQAVLNVMIDANNNLAIQGSATSSDGQTEQINEVMIRQ